MIARPFLFILLAAGLWAPALVAQIEVSVNPTSITFPDTVLGDVSVPSSFEITGTTPVRLVSSDSAFEMLNSQGVWVTDLNLSLDGSQEVQVRFVPLSLGSISGTIDILDTGGNVLATVQVSGQGVPPITFSPSPLDFGTVPVGQTATIDLTISVVPQDRIESLDLDIGVFGSNPNFQVDPDAFQNLSAGEEVQTTVTFQPVNFGEIRSNLVVAGSVFSPPFNVFVPLQGVGSGFQLSASVLDFEGVVLNCPRTLPLTITPGGEADFAITTTTPGITVSPASFSGSQEQIVNVTFDPQTEGFLGGSLSIEASQDGQVIQTEVVELSGAGTTLAAFPESIDFGDVIVGGASSVTPFFVSATQDVAVDLTVEASSDTAAFAVAGTAGPQVDIVFSPVSEGAAAGVITATPTVTYDLACSIPPIAVPVTGNGVPSPLTLTPTSLDFGRRPVGSESDAQVVTIQNASQQGFSGGTVTSSSPEFLVTPRSFSLGPSEEFSFDVVFLPAGGGPKQATLTFTIPEDLDSQGQELVLNLPAVGEGFSFTVDPLSLDFGEIDIDGSSTLPVTLTNVLDEALPITTSISDAQFSVAEPSFSIPAAGQTIVDVTFAPTQAGEFSTAAVFSAGSNVEETVEVTLLGRTPSPVPGAEITGVEVTVEPNQQPLAGVQLTEAAPADFQGTLTMTFEPAEGLPDDAMVQFANGQRSANFTIPAGETLANFDGSGESIGFQTGTVAGTIRFVASFVSGGGSDVTPDPPPTGEATVPVGVPVITAISVEGVTATGFTAIVTGYSTTRQMTSATFRFTGRSGVQVQPSSLSPSGVGEAFTTWYQEQIEDSSQFGSQFTLSVPFTIQGANDAVRSVSATLTNDQGESSSQSVTLP